MVYDDAEIASLLCNTERIAIVGMSRSSIKPSYEVAVYLQSEGYEVVPVNPMYTEIFGKRSFDSVSAVPGRVDLVVVFAQAQGIPDIARDALEKMPKSIWLQTGIRGDAVAAEVEGRGVRFYQDVCIKETHQRLSKERS
jgi:predicted CoA-binding protein